MVSLKECHRDQKDSHRCHARGLPSDFTNDLLRKLKWISEGVLPKSSIGIYKESRRNFKIITIGIPKGFLSGSQKNSHRDLKRIFDWIPKRFSLELLKGFPLESHIFMLQLSILKNTNHRLFLFPAFEVVQALRAARLFSTVETQTVTRLKESIKFRERCRQLSAMPFHRMFRMTRYA